MENILLAKIVETEDIAEKIISDSKITANNLIEEHTLKYNTDKKEIEKKYDEILISGQERIKKEFDAEFEKKLSELKIETQKIGDHSIQIFDKALNILLSGVNCDGNS